MKVVFAERARRDISEIFEAISTDSPAAAKRVITAIKFQCERLAQFPNAASATDEPNVYRVPMVRFPYTVFYRVNLRDDRIEIVRVLHGARVKDLWRPPHED